MENNVAKTILGQLGGNRFAFMTGAKNLTGSANALTFRFGRNATSANVCRVTLEASDLYTVDFLRVTTRGTKIVAKLEDVFAEDLAPQFAATTGLALSL